MFYRRTGVMINVFICGTGTIIEYLWPLVLFKTFSPTLLLLTGNQMYTAKTVIGN